MSNDECRMNSFSLRHSLDIEHSSSISVCSPCLRGEFVSLLLGGVVGFAVTIGLAAATFADEEAGDELVQLVVELLGDSDKDVRALAFEQVRSEAKGQAATKQFAAQLPKLSPDAQVGLLRALANRGDTAARPNVLDMIANSRNETVKAAAIGALSTLGEPPDARLLVRLLAAGSKAEKAAARQSLIRLRGESAPAAIAKEMKLSSPQLRVALIEVLAARRALDTIPSILPAAVDTDPLVRAAAMTALGKLAGREHIAGMVQGVLRAEMGRERAAAEKSVMFVCARIAGAQKRAEPLLAVMDQLGDADRLAIMPTLGRVGGSAALEIVEATIADPDPGKHDIGLRALCHWPNASVAPRLIELASSDEHAEHRTMALRALIRVAPLPDKRPNIEKLKLLQTAMKMSTRDKERLLVLQRARAIRIPETLRFIMPYLDQLPYAEQACETVVELAHHRNLREPNKAEFHRALDKVIRTSKDATVVDRASRYKKNQTWVRPAASSPIIPSAGSRP